MLHGSLLDMAITCASPTLVSLLVPRRVKRHIYVSSFCSLRSIGFGAWHKSLAPFL